MTTGPLRHTFAFFKPRLSRSELEGVASYSDPGDPLRSGVNVWRGVGPAQACRVELDGGDDGLALFAAVHRIERVPAAARVLARVVDANGEHCSFVLHYPDSNSVVVPFDPAAATEALWQELYTAGSRSTVLPQPLLTLYYRSLRRFFPPGARVRLRRLLGRTAKQQRHLLGWPGDDSLDRLQRLMLELVLTVSESRRLEFVWFWPESRSWAVVLTHDVETAAGLARVRDVAALESKHGLRSSYNLVSIDYDVPDALVEQLHADGFEVGVHGYTHDGLLFSDWRTFSTRVETINERARRWGAVGFRSPATYRKQEWYHALEFEYDSSYSDSAPYEPQPGGCGTWFPFEAGGLLELPITVPQDHTLFGLLGHRGASIWSSKLAAIERAHGMACVLTHPDPDAGYIGLPDNEAHYVALIESVAASGAWTPLPCELVRWWRAREAVDPQRPEQLPGLSFGVATLDEGGRLDLVSPPRA